MTAIFIQRSDTIDYTPPADVPVGSVTVLNDTIGINRTALQANQLGSLAIDGIFELDKNTGANQAIEQGKNVFWDTVNLRVRKSNNADSVLMGKAATSAGDDDSRVRVSINK